MKKLLMLVLCLGITFAFGACQLGANSTSSNNSTESSESIDNSSETSSDNSEDNSENNSEGNSEDNSEDNSSVTPPIIDGENEMPLVPIG